MMPRRRSRSTATNDGARGGSGGVIVAGPDGSAGWAFNTAGMYRGMISHDAPAEIAIYGDE